MLLVQTCSFMTVSKARCTQKWKNVKQLETRLLIVLWKFLPTAFHSWLVFLLKLRASNLSILILIIELDVLLNILMVYIVFFIWTSQNWLHTWPKGYCASVV